MSLLNRKRTILSKIETAYGTDSVPTGAANAILVKNINVTPMETQLVSRDLIRPYMGNSQNLAASVYGKLELEVELAGSGTAGTAPAFGPLLRACGLSETISAGTSVIYAPVSASFESVTNYFNLDGVLHKMTGSRGSVSVAFSAQGIPTLKFSFQGLYSPVVDSPAPTGVVFSAFQLPLIVNNVNTTGLSLQSFSGMVLSDLSIDLANSLTFRSLVGGTEQVLITDRKPAGSITFEATTVAAKDWWTAARNAATGSLTVTHGTVAGNKVTIAAPLAQITQPTYSDKDGIAMIQASLVLVPNAGNDELTFTFL
ncbi:phage tail tube protein [Massilia rhizosphaerae]|uniref:phage tail tube protein n=1 Tax=Massilia rhizosphaerae TaxID=2784389 RepID=UPI0018DE3A93|nr:phage tail tube protein [Massilia rhizosphaerae]